MAKKGGRHKKVKPEGEPIITPSPPPKAPIRVELVEAPTPEPIQTKIPAMQDRMMRYGYRKPRSCPQCSERPVVTRIKRKGYALYRCRACGHQWEITI